MSAVVAERVAEKEWELHERERMLADMVRYVRDLEDHFDRQRFEYRQFAKELRWGTKQLQCNATAPSTQTLLELWGMFSNQVVLLVLQKTVF